MLEHTEACCAEMRGDANFAMHLLAYTCLPCHALVCHAIHLFAMNLSAMNLSAAHLPAAHLSATHLFRPAAQCRLRRLRRERAAGFSPHSTYLYTSSIPPWPQRQPARVTCRLKSNLGAPWVETRKHPEVPPRATKSPASTMHCTPP